MEKEMIFYLIVFILLFAAELIYFKIAERYNIIDKPNPRSSHTIVTLRGGGVIFYLAALAYSVMNGLAYPWFILGLTMIAGISFMDDIRALSQKIRLLFHFIGALLMFYQWGLFTLYPWWSLLPILIVCVSIINIYNFMDGINGITGGYSLIVLLSLAYINRQIVSFIQPDLLYVMIISALVFNFFNFRTKAKCFAGDVGSISMAFIILFALGKLIILTGDLTYIILLSVYGVDAVLTIMRRLFSSENIFKPHRKHAFQLMVNELKINHLKVSSCYILVQVLVMVGYFLLPAALHWVYFIGVVFILSLGYIGFIFRYSHLQTDTKAMNVSSEFQ